MIRLDKYLGEMGCGTRSELKKKIRKGMAKVDGQIITVPEFKLDPDVSVVMWQEQEIGYIKNEYYMLNKPAGYVSAVTDRHDKTVLELIEEKQRKDLFPVGRLDKDTEGLLLITNDGALSHRLLSPAHHVEKVYYAEIKGVVTEEDVVKFKEGLSIGEKKNTMPAKLEILQSGPESEILLTICEGKFHQVKRMFEAVDKKVVYLKRMAMGTLTLDEALQPGEYRKLTNEELESLRKE